MAEETKEKDTQEQEQEAPAEASADEAGTPKEEKKEEAEETKTEDVSTEAEGEEVEVPEKFKALIEQIEQMPVLELNELVKVLEKKFGVSAVAVAAPAAGGAAEGGAEEQDSFTVELTEAGGQKIAVIKAVKEILGLGLKEAKDMVEGAPVAIKEGANKEESEEMKGKLEEAGATVTLK